MKTRWIKTRMRRRTHLSSPRYFFANSVSSTLRACLICSANSRELQISTTNSFQLSCTISDEKSSTQQQNNSFLQSAMKCAILTDPRSQPDRECWEHCTKTSVRGVRARSARILIIFTLSCFNYVTRI